MLSIICGLAGAACCVGAWNAVDRAEGAKVALYGLAALALFGVTIFGTAAHKPYGYCTTEWDGRANSEVCE